MTFHIGMSSSQLTYGLEHEFYIFPYIGNVIIPTDFHIFEHSVNLSIQLGIIIIPTDEVHDFSEGLVETTNQ